MKKILLFELNEVPLRILDAYRAWRPASVLARSLPRMRQYETLTEDTGHLSPWVTWPSLHRGVPDARHGIVHFGQDLGEVDGAYPPMWELLARHGVSTGVFGSLHSYPLPGSLDGYAFYFPDTFAAGSECFPSSLSPVQELNLQMARESARNVSSRIPWRAALRVLARAPGLGLRARTLAGAARQVVAEVVAPPRRVRRRTTQVELAFDLFMRQLELRTPAFATFFTNHVASTMHRYWAATFPEDYLDFGYDAEWVRTYRGEIDFTMTRFDRMLGRLLAFVDRRPEYRLMIATSMGQGPTVARPVASQLHVSDLERFMGRLGVPVGAWSRRPAMAPQVNLFVAPEHVETFRGALRRLEVAGHALDWVEREAGFFSVSFGHPDPVEREGMVRLDGRDLGFAELGLFATRIEDQTGTCAYHVPQGSLLVYDPADPAKAAGAGTRPQVSTLELAPTILRNFGAPVPSYMRAAATF
jgi:hypothetical protein